MSDAGWVVEQLVSQLVAGLSYIDSGLEDRKNYAVAYHFPYMTFVDYLAPHTLCFFTHEERDEVRKAMFWRSAEAAEVCICQSPRYSRLLETKYPQKVVIISPGIDLERYRPEVKIGVVGRTYDSGRKGETLISKLMDLPGIKWHFTGSGWPQQSVALSSDEMPRFYNEMDYILISSLYEGGPMCALEALACGVEVIAPDVGWMSELPHIPFTLGDASSLRNVLEHVVNKRTSLRQSVLDRTIDRWIEGHDTVFQRYLKDS